MLSDRDQSKLPQSTQRGWGNFVFHPLAWLLAVLAGTALAYLPGLHGPFLFDDAPNIVEPVSAWIARQISWQEIAFGNHSGPLHRPLSMLTFVANAAASGLSPWSFKVTNLTIHLICGVLIFALLSRLLARDPLLRTHARHAALIVSAIWLLHPIQVSTVLYVVQRMEQLCALFVLIALLIYVHGRNLLEKGSTRAALLNLFLFLPLTTLAAMFSKENGALVPVFCAALELGYFRSTSTISRPPTVRLFFAAFLLTPAVLVVGWYSLHPHQLANAYSGRLFTLGERLLSEPRALMDYMGALLLPRGPSLGLYTDDFVISRNLLVPISTLPAMIGLIALVATAYLSRKRIPSYFVGIFFYLGGHVMESTVFPLELYFEHRNYLPSVGFFLAVVGLMYWLLFRFLPRVSNPDRFVRLFVNGTVAILVALGIATMARASVWNSWPALAAQGARQHPNSIRAQTDFATNLVASGRFDEAQRVIRHIATIPSPAARNLAAIDTVLLQCLIYQTTDASAVATINHIKGTKLQLSEMLAFEMLGRVINAKLCRGLNEAQLANIIVRIVDAAPQPGTLMQIWRSRYIASRLYLDADQLVEANQQASLAWESRSADPAVGMFLANLEYINGDQVTATQVLAEAVKRTAWWDRRNLELARKLRKLFESPPPVASPMEKSELLQN